MPQCMLHTGKEISFYHKCPNSREKGFTCTCSLFQQPNKLDVKTNKKRFTRDSFIYNRSFSNTDNNK